MKSFGITDKGLVREYNEDHFYRSDNEVGNLPNLYIVADGMGGHKAGDIASKQAVAYMIQYIEETKESDVSVLLTDAVLYANEHVYNEGQSKRELNGMGTTLVACTVSEDVVYVVNVGDSRMYLKSEAFEQVTMDHSVVEELYRAGHITEEQRFTHPDRNVITRAIGAESTVAVDYFSESVSGDDLILMCSDGLNKMIHDSTICSLLEKEESLESKANTLIDGAKDLGGSDNITVVLVNVGNEVNS